MAKLTQQELERHLWGAADILRGTVDAGDYKQYIFGLLFYKRLCDVWQEEYEALLAETGDREEAADPDEHRFHVPAEHRWEAVRQQSTQIGQRLNNALAAIEDANLRLRGVFGSVDFANQDRFSDALLEKLLTHFEKHRLRNADAPADMLGDAYLYLIKMFAEGSGKKGGEFYTPRQIVRLMIEIIEPRPGMSVYDPTCGSGGMLLEAVQYLKDRGEDARSLSLYGQEKNFATWGIAQINMFLHNVDDTFIAKGDTILSPKRYDPRVREFVEGVGAYDRVLANPPFSEKVWGHDVWSNGDPFGRDAYGCPPKGYGDLAFVQHMLASLKDDGILAVVVPHGVLFRGGAEGRIREAMLAADVIEAVVGLAPNLFYGASIPAALLICRKNKPSDRRGKVLIVNGDATYQAANAQNFLTDEHVRTLADTVHGFATIDKLARVVPLEEIVADKHSLNISRYVKIGADAKAVDLTVEVSKLQGLMTERARVEAQMMHQLAQLDHANVDHGSWTRRTLGSLFDFINGCAFKPEEWSDSGTPIIRIQNLNGSESFNFFDGDKPEKYHVRAGDLLFCWSGSRGTSFGARKWHGPLGYLNQHIFRCVISPELDLDFAYYLLEGMTPAIEAEAHGGGGLVHIKKSEIVRFEAMIPSRPEQMSIARVMASVDRSIEVNHMVVGKGGGNAGDLIKLKQHLLKSLLSGHIRVPA